MNRSAMGLEPGREKPATAVAERKELWRPDLPVRGLRSDYQFGSLMFGEILSWTGDSRRASRREGCVWLFFPAYGESGDRTFVLFNRLTGAKQRKRDGVA